MNEDMRQNLQRTIKALVENQELLEASMKPMAQLLKAKLDALITAGFTREEAMEIIKARGLEA